MSEPASLGRREFLRVAGRHVAMGTLVAGTAALVLLPAPKEANDAVCIRFLGCGGCGALSQCGLPRAEMTRQNMTRRSDHEREQG